MRSMRCWHATCRLAPGPSPPQGSPTRPRCGCSGEPRACVMTSRTDRPHRRRLERNPKVAVCVDVEEPEREDGQRPNRQVRGTGEADLFPDADGFWTRVITEKYIGGPARAARSAARTADPRTVI